VVRVDEDALERFRVEQLSPSAILDHVQHHKHIVLRIGLGGGKSVAIDKTTTYAGTYKRFGLVIYVAPSWAVINERVGVRDPASVPVETLVVLPRPVDRCGWRAKAWKQREQMGCAALAKADLCRPCQAESARNPCEWPDQLRVPMLLLAGAADATLDPAAHTLALARGLQTKRLPYSLVVYDGDTHGLTFSGTDRDARILDWFARHRKVNAP
jgi:pimeloyl-ACP methyl ester carboxylesterase